MLVVVTEIRLSPDSTAPVSGAVMLQVGPLTTFTTRVQVVAAPVTLSEAESRKSVLGTLPGMSPSEFQRNVPGPAATPAAGLTSNDPAGAPALAVAKVRPP